MLEQVLEQLRGRALVHILQQALGQLLGQVLDHMLEQVLGQLQLHMRLVILQVAMLSSHTVALGETARIGLGKGSLCVQAINVSMLHHNVQAELKFCATGQLCKAHGHGCSSFFV